MNDDVLGAIIDLRKLNESLDWLRKFAERKWDSKNKGLEVHYEKDFFPFHIDEFRDCPHFELGLYALTILRPDIIKDTKKNPEIKQVCIARLAKIKS